MARGKNLINWHVMIAMKTSIFVSQWIADCPSSQRISASLHYERLTDLAWNDASPKEYLARAPMLLVSQGTSNHLRDFDSLTACRSINV